MYKKILLAVDGSDQSNRARDKAIELAKDFDSRLVAFHAVEYRAAPKRFRMPIIMPFTDNYYYNVPREDYDVLNVQLYKAGERVLAETNQAFEKENINAEARLVEDREPEQYAVERVDEEGFDLVVAGCAGNHSKFERILLGTKAQHILNHANCDVLIAR